MKRLIFLLAFFIGTFLVFFVNDSKMLQVQACNRKVYLWNLSNIDSLNTATHASDLRKTILERAEKLVTQPPVSVTSHEKKFAPNRHYFECIGPYWWPNSENPFGPWINKDGKVNPESKNYDNVLMDKMTDRMQYLSIAFYISDEKKYYDAAVSQLNVWFVNKDTYMYPNLEYGQVIPGKNANKGRSTGIISTYSFINNTLESIRLIESKKQLPETTSKEIKKWFTDYLDWCVSSEFGIECSKGNQNIAIAYDVMLYNMSLYTGNSKIHKRIKNNFSKTRLDVQIKQDGSQPEELKRTMAMGYSIYNLTHILDFCIICETEGYHYYDENKTRIDAAVDFLASYLGRKDEWPYQQATDWNICERDLCVQINRMKKLKHFKANKYKCINNFFSYSSLPIMLF